MNGRGSYEPRTYRRLARAEGLVRFGVTLEESDLAVWARRELRAEAAAALQAVRAELRAYLRRHQGFVESLQPLDPLPGAPEVVRRMCAAGAAAGVGPMAAVAGTIAQRVAEALETESPEVIVENGGDVYLVTQEERRVAIVAPGSRLSGKMALKIPAGARMAVCTSSGRHGHSLSLGRADATVVAATDGALADAMATALGNRVRRAEDLVQALEWARGVDGVVQAVVCSHDRFGAFGSLEILPTGSDTNG